jgi:hypothetical protein
VHLGDENGHKRGGNDKRCMMDARLDGRPPIAVTQQAPPLDQAVDGGWKSSSDRSTVCSDGSTTANL